MTRNSPSKPDRSPPSSYNRTDTDNSRRGGSSRKGRSRRSHSDSRSRSRSRSRDRGGSRSKKSSRSHRRHDRSRSRERSSRRDRSRSRSRSHRRSRSRSGSRSRNQDRPSGQGKATAGAAEAVASRAPATAAGSVAVAAPPAPTAAAAPSPAVATGIPVSVAPTSVASVTPPGVSAALAAARAAAIRSGLMPVGALGAPPPVAIPGTLPSYYNPTQVNVLKYSEQMQKRKLLWKKPQAEGTGSAPTEAPADKQQQQPTSTCAKVWERMTFAEDQDGKVTAKFRKLMGIRGEPPPPTDKPDPAANPLLKQQEKLFHDLDQQYEAARVSTHTHRGVGLGYSSQMAAYFQQQQSLNPK